MYVRMCYLPTRIITLPKLQQVSLFTVNNHTLTIFILTRLCDLGWQGVGMKAAPQRHILSWHSIQGHEVYVLWILQREHNYIVDKNWHSWSSAVWPDLSLFYGLSDATNLILDLVVLLGSYDGDGLGCIAFDRILSAVLHCLKTWH